MTQMEIGVSQHDGRKQRLSYEGERKGEYEAREEGCGLHTAVVSCCLGNGEQNNEHNKQHCQGRKLGGERRVW